MKLQPINRTNPAQMQNNRLNFKGLWGKDTYEYGEINVLDSYNYTEKHYFPFHDELKESIDKIVKENTSAYENYSYYTNDCPEWGGVYTKTKVAVERRLPFSEGEWKKYISDTASINKSLKSYIETSLRRFKLTHLIK